MLPKACGKATTAMVPSNTRLRSLAALSSLYKSGVQKRVYYGLNSLNEMKKGSTIRVIKEDTRSLDYSLWLMWSMSHA